MNKYHIHFPTEDNPFGGCYQEVLAIDIQSAIHYAERAHNMGCSVFLAATKAELKEIGS